jgi:hypothetical protein
MISLSFPAPIHRGILYIRNLAGQVLYTEAISYAGSMEVSLGEFEAGLYLVEVVSGEGQRYV